MSACKKVSPSKPYSLIRVKRVLDMLEVGIKFANSDIFSLLQIQFEKTGKMKQFLFQICHNGHIYHVNSTILSLSPLTVALKILLF